MRNNFLSFSLLLLALCFPFSNVMAINTPPLVLTVWSCKIPCQTDEEPPRTLKSVQIAWCGAQVLSQEMVDKITPACRNLNRRKDARAVLHSAAESIADCSSSGNHCEQEGFSHLGYMCRVTCPGQAIPLKYSVCATDTQEAWKASSKVCAHGKFPSDMPQSQVCVAEGQTPCNP